MINDLSSHSSMTSRYPIMSTNGMVCTSSALASQAGLDMLKRGGNAVDAALATAITLTVTEPTNNGVGSDAFAIIWMNNKMYGINGSGNAPVNINAEEIASKKSEDGKIPCFGWTPVMVPGAPKTWYNIWERFGSLPFEELFEPAIKYAGEGFPIGAHMTETWGNSSLFRYKEKYINRPEFEEFYKHFSVNGEIPKPGTILKMPELAASLRLIAKTGTDAFYKGEIAKKIVSECERYGGYLTMSDFTNYNTSWVNPISVNYRGYDVWEIPPNGQGIVTLMALNILKNYNIKTMDQTEAKHVQMEAVKLAFSDALQYITDPSCMNVDYNSFLHEEYGKKRAKEIKDKAISPTISEPPRSGTVYLCTADKYGNMVSMIQSNYMGFGSGILVKGTGITLQNRGHDFSLDPKHVNYLRPGKKTYHTIIPGFITKDGKAVGPFGVMGGYMQPQGHVQILVNMIDCKMNPQMALDEARWQWVKDKEFIIEPHFPYYTANRLMQKGHEIKVEAKTDTFGRGQIILRREDGVLVGATESRADSNIACY